jgi:hypothetical protein
MPRIASAAEHALPQIGSSVVEAGVSGQELHRLLGKV